MNKLIALSSVLLTVYFGGAVSAHAAPIVFGTGERIHEIQNLPNNETSLGYFQKSFTIFWMPVAQWDGKFVLHKGDTYRSFVTDSPSAIAEVTGLPQSAVSKPFLAYIPWGWFVLGPIALIWIGSKSK